MKKNENEALETLFDRYLFEPEENPQEKRREAAYAKLDGLVEDNTDAAEALIDFQYEAMKAAFFAGFRIARELFTA